MRARERDMRFVTLVFTPTTKYLKTLSPTSPSRADEDYSSMVTGSSMNPLKAPIHSAPTAPSMTR